MSQKTFRRRIWRGAIALAVVIVLQVCDYFITNFTYPLLDSVDSLMVLDYLTKNGEAPERSEVMYVNVGYDKKLVTKLDEFGDTVGVLTITDRKLLADFLDLISSADYKYVFLDIRFEKGTESEDDSLLFSVMERLDHLSFSTHRDMETLVPESLMHKSAYSDFRGNFKDGFTRFELMQDGHPSSALKILEETTGQQMDKKGPFYYIDGDLAYNMIFVPFYRNDSQEYGNNGFIKYPYLGYSMRDPERKKELQEKAEGKLVVVGDFENDRHQTYMGDVPGPVLTVRTYQMLEKGREKFSWICFGITSAVYLLILYVLLGNIDLNAKICKILKIKSPVLAYLLSFIGWGFILSLVKILLYVIFGIAFVVFLPAITFSTISFIKDYRS